MTENVAFVLKTVERLAQLGSISSSIYTVSETTAGERREVVDIKTKIPMNTGTLINSKRCVHSGAFP